MIVVEPSGIVVDDYDRFCCIGKGSDAVQRALEERFENYDSDDGSDGDDPNELDNCETDEEVERLLLEVLEKSGAAAAGAAAGSSPSSEWLLEILDETGHVKRRWISLAKAVGGMDQKRNRKA